MQTTMVSLSKCQYPPQVVDSADKERLRVCRDELQRLLKEEKLAGATLLILANKQDLPGALSAADIKQVALAQPYKSAPK